MSISLGCTRICVGFFVGNRHCCCAERDRDVGRLQAAVDRARMAEAAAQADVLTEREGKQVLAEEVRLLRQSIAAQEMERLKRQVRLCRAGVMDYQILTACARQEIKNFSLVLLW